MFLHSREDRRRTVQIPFYERDIRGFLRQLLRGRGPRVSCDREDLEGRVSREEALHHRASLFSCSAGDED